MINLILNQVIIFLTIFSILSILRLLINFVRSLLSNPPQPLVLDSRSIIYYGICLSFIITVIINKI